MTKPSKKSAAKPASKADRDVIVRIIEATVPEEVGKLSDSKPLAVIGADSLDVVEIIMSVEEEFDVVIPEDDQIAVLPDQLTIGWLLQQVKKARANGPYAVDGKK